MSVSLRGKLPPNDRDGLQTIASKFGTKRGREAPVVLVLECYLDRVVEKLYVEDDPKDYVLAVAHIEELVDDGDQSFARSLLLQRYESRTGKSGLPFGTTSTEEP